MDKLPYDIIYDLVVNHGRWNALSGIHNLSIVEDIFKMHPVKTLEELIVWGNIEVFEILRRRYKIEYHPFMIRAAIRSNSEDVIDYFIGVGKVPPSNAMEIAAEYNCRNSYNKLYSLGYRPTECTVKSAAEHGNLDFLRFLIATGVPVDETSIIAAAYNGHINAVIYLASIHVPGLDAAMNSAAGAGHLNIVQYLDSIGVQPTTDTMYTAVRNGHLDVVKYVYDAGVYPTEMVVREAVRNNYTDIVELFESMNIPIPTVDDVDPELEFLWNNNDDDDGDDESTSLITPDVDIGTATRCGWINKLQELYRLGGRPTSDDYFIAIANGHLDVVRFLFNGFRNDDEVALLTAAHSGNILIVKFFWEMGLRSVIPSNLADTAASAGRLAVLEFLFSQGVYPRENITISVARNGHLATLMFLHANRYPLPINVADELEDDGLYLAVAEYIRRHT